MKKINDKTYYSGDEVCQIANHQFNEGIKIGQKEMRDYIYISFNQFVDDFKLLGISKDSANFYREFNAAGIHWLNQLLNFFETNAEKIENIKEFSVGDLSIKPHIERTKDLKAAEDILGFQFEDEYYKNNENIGTILHISAECPKIANDILDKIKKEIE